MYQALTLTLSFALFPERNELNFQKVVGACIFFSGLVLQLLSQSKYVQSFYYSSTGSTLPSSANHNSTINSTPSKADDSLTKKITAKNGRNEYDLESNNYENIINLDSESDRDYYNSKKDGYKKLLESERSSFKKSTSKNAINTATNISSSSSSKNTKIDGIANSEEARLEDGQQDGLDPDLSQKLMFASSDSYEEINYLNAPSNSPKHVF